MSDPMDAANGAIQELRGQLHAALDRCANFAARIAELEATKEAVKVADEVKTEDTE
jgi:hypothetical protein